MVAANNKSEIEVVQAPDLSLNDVIDALFRRRRVIFLVVVLGLLAAVVLMLRPRKYTATGVIRVQPGTASMYRTSPSAFFAGEESGVIASEAAIIQSRSVYLQVAKELGLANDPAFWGTSHIKPQSLDDPKTREKVIRLMKSEINVDHDPKDELITISCTTIAPALSSKIVNTLINDYISSLFQMRYGSTRRVSGWLIGQLDDLKQQIERDQTEIISLQKKLGVIGLNEQNAEYLQTEALDSITKAASESTVKRILAEARLRKLQESDPNLVEGEDNLLSQGAGGSQNSLLQNLRNARAQAASNYARLLAQFGPNYPEVRQQKAQLDQIDKEVDTEQQRILNQAQLSYNAAKANESMDKSLLQNKTSEAFNSGGDMVRYMLLLHDYQSHRGLYEQLVQRLREAGITSGLEAGEIGIVDLADLPAIPNSPGPLLLLVGGLLGGTIFGCFVVLGLDALNTRIANEEQAERATNLPLLAIVPHAESRKQKSSNSIPPSTLIGAPGTRYAEALQSLRTSILLAKPGMAPKVILVTSAIPREGKSMTASNLAKAFARHGRRVLLVDCDLRRGTQAAILDVDGGKGLSGVLTQQTPIGEAIQPVPGFDGLYLLAGGPLPPDPAVLIGSEQMDRLVQECANAFDVVVLDSAPVLGLADTITLGRLAEAVIVVVRERVSSRRAVQDSVARIRNARLPVIGFVLNDVDVRAHAYGYGYGYGSSSEGYYAEDTK